MTPDAAPTPSRPLFGSDVLAADLVRELLGARLVGVLSRPGFEVCGVSIRGRVEIVEGDTAKPLIDRVHRRYVMPAGELLPAAGQFLASDDLALRLLPDAAFTWDERASSAARELRDAGAALALEPTASRGGGER